MDTKVLFRALLWSFVAFFAWQIVAVQIWRPPPRSEQQATTQPVEGEEGTATADAPAASDRPGESASGAQSGPSDNQGQIFTVRSAETADRDKRVSPLDSRRKARVSSSDLKDPNRQNPVEARDFPGLDLDVLGKSLPSQTQWRWGESWGSSYHHSFP